MEQRHETVMMRISTAASRSSPTDPAESAKPSDSQKNLPPSKSEQEQPLDPDSALYALQRPAPVPASDQITILKLASELHCGIRRVGELIEHGYIRIIYRQEGTFFCYTIVARPYPAALEWLRGMVAPLRLRPMLPVEGVAEHIGLTVNDLRRMALHYNIPLALDPFFGELISTTGYNRLLRAQHELRNPMRTDRQAMLLTLVRMNRNTNAIIAKKPVMYSKRLESEIRLICKMTEPLRSLRAAALWSAYNEAKTVAECVKNYAGILKQEQKSGGSKMLEESMEFLRAQITSSAKHRWVRNLKNPKIQGKVKAQRKRWAIVQARKVSAAAEGGEPSSSES